MTIDPMVVAVSLSPLLGVRKLKEDLAGLEGEADGTLGITSQRSKV